MSLSTLLNILFKCLKVSVQATNLQMVNITECSALGDNYKCANSFKLLF